MHCADETTTPRSYGVLGRILLAVSGGCTGSNELRALFGACAQHTYHQRLHEAVERGWLRHTLTLTDAGKAAIERMK